MSTAHSLEMYLYEQNISYGTLAHRQTNTSFNAAVCAHVPSNEVSKAVILEDEDHNLLMAVVPSSRRLSLGEVYHVMGKQYFMLDEDRLYKLFPDCAEGATPAMGDAYDIEMLVDNSLFDVDKVYIEAGDHKHLLVLDHKDYVDLMQEVATGSIAGSSIGFKKTDWESNAHYVA